MQINKQTENTRLDLPMRMHYALGPTSRTDLSLFSGLNLMQSDSWLSLSLFLKLAPGHCKSNDLKSYAFGHWEFYIEISKYCV